MPSAFNTTADGWPYITGDKNASLIDDYALELATKLDLAVPFAVAAGTVDVTISAATSGSAAVTFPAGRFSQAPIVQLTKVDTDSGAQLTIPMVTANSASGMTASLYATATQTVTVTLHWVAIQMDTGAAAG